MLKDKSQSQIDLKQFCYKLQDYLSFNEDLSVDQIPQLIINQFNKQQQIFDQQYQILKKDNYQLRNGYFGFCFFYYFFLFF